MKKIFWADDRRLRTLWRVLLQLAGLFILILVTGSWQDKSAENGNWLQWGLSSVIYLAGMIVLLWGLARWPDKRRLSGFGLKINASWWKVLAAGFIFGTLTLTGTALLDWRLGWVEFTLSPTSLFSGPTVLIIVSALLYHLSVAVGEELTFRSYQITNLIEGLKGKLGQKAGITVALLISSIIFGMLHLLNPHATLLAGFNSTFAGVVFGMGFLLTGKVALPLGFHFAWNLCQESVLGFSNSGQNSTGTIFQARISGPDLWTGGVFGPEGGLLVTGMLILDVLLILLWVKAIKRHKNTS